MKIYNFTAYQKSKQFLIALTDIKDMFVEFSTKLKKHEQFYFVQLLQEAVKKYIVVVDKHLELAKKSNDAKGRIH